MDISHMVARLDHGIKKYGVKVIPMGLNRAFLKIRDSYDSLLFSSESKIHLDLLRRVESETCFIDLSCSPLQWYGSLFQRYKHMAIEFANLGGLSISGTLPKVDGVRFHKKLNNNHWIINPLNTKLRRCLEECAKKATAPVLVRVQSTDFSTSLEDILRWKDLGFFVLYEYIDPFSPEISVHIPSRIITRHQFCCSDKSIFVCCTADSLMEEVSSYRDNVFLSKNAVDLRHWKGDHKKKCECRKIMNLKKPVIGYHGALASWIDYDLLRYLANTKKYSILLIGPKYDKSFDDSGIESCKDIHYIGTVDYNDLPSYVYDYDVAIVPFKVNELTHAVSPLKLFEYMAAGKPIVTTETRECIQYKSCLTANNFYSFLQKIDTALSLKDNIEYRNIIYQDALNNSWEQRAKKILKNCLNLVIN
ncbi:glycosyltransferase [Bilophila wadsworthia]|uniref:glycosyltransferase n=1 Tax=Bilophila wadsworthia TaxID=35833 RepID=UPI00242DE693|nr:glycosyltransferase [Bilophila wadsworthia]